MVVALVVLAVVVFLDDSESDDFRAVNCTYDSEKKLHKVPGQAPHAVITSSTIVSYLKIHVTLSTLKTIPEH